MTSPSHVAQITTEALTELLAQVTPDWCIYSEPDVGLPPSLFAGRVGYEGFGPIEPLSGYDLRLASLAPTIATDLLTARSQIEALEAREAAALARVRVLEAALRPFSDVAELDIGDGEADIDLFQPMIRYNRACLITVGDMRRARAALNQEVGGMSLDNYSTDGAICPHCEYLNRPQDGNYSLYLEETDEWECGSCSETFVVSVFIQHSWTTEKSHD